MADSDELRSLRNYFYLGMLSNVITEAKNSSSTGAKVFYMRAMLETKPDEVFAAVDDRAPTGLQAVKLLGTYRKAAPDQKELAMETLKEWLQDEMLGQDGDLQLVASQMYFEEGDYKEALKAVFNHGESLEKLAMQMQIYLKLDRVDLAAKAARLMADIDDDDALTQLCTSWLYIAQGAEKVTEASFLLQELVDKFGPSVTALVGQAVCQIQLGNLAEANSHLKQARNMGVVGGGKVDSAVLVNFIVCLHSQRKPNEIIQKIQGELMTSHPDHPWSVQQDTMSQLFDQHAANYAL